LESSNELHPKREKMGRGELRRNRGSGWERERNELHLGKTEETYVDANLPGTGVRRSQSTEEDQIRWGGNEQ